MSDDDLSRVNLHTWQAPSPRSVDHDALFARVIAPATQAPRRRMPWMVGALVLGNLALVAALIVVITQRPEPSSTVTYLAAGGGVDPSALEAMRKLEREKRELTQKIADIQQLQSTIESLSDQIKKCEQTVKRAAPDKKRIDEELAKEDVPASDPPEEAITKVLNAPPSDDGDHLTRDDITKGVATVRAAILRCSPQTSRVVLKLKVQVTPDGKVARVNIGDSPPVLPKLGACAVIAMKKAQFRRTKNGGSFSYPFVLGVDFDLE